FSMKDLGELHHFLGMHVQRHGDGLLLSQWQYMLDILDRAGMADCKPCSTPVDTNPKVAAAKAGRKTRNSLARSTRSLVARLELDSFYSEPACFITSQLAL